MYRENNVQVNIHEPNSKLVYSVLIKKLCQDSIAETHFNKKYGIMRHCIMSVRMYEAQL